jgi:RNA polymerase sigma-70 factor (ECF subfamily)
MDGRELAMVNEWYLDSVGRVRQALSSRLSRPEDIDDLAQEVYLRLLRAPRPDLIKNPQAYLYRIALNVAQEWRQRAAQAMDHGGIVEALEAEGDPEDESASLELDEAVLEIIQGLPLTQRSALILHVIDGMTYEQVAEHMGVSRRAVKRYVANGYAALRGRITGGSIS